MASVLAEGHVFDTKFPIATLPHACMQSEKVKSDVHKTVATVVAWSLKAAATGLWPSQGPFGEALTGHRAEMAGGEIAGGHWRAVYFGFRGDEKARKETNAFQRSYQHSKICMYCCAEQHNKQLIPEMLYKNFHSSAAHRLSPISPSSL